MISRRNIRVKVMQLLYVLETLEDNTAIKDPVKALQQQFDKSEALFTYIIYFLTEICRFAETDARNRASKNLPSAADMNVNTRIAGNTVLWQILEYGSYQQALETHNIPSLLDKELVKKLYNELIEKKEYQLYTVAEGREKNKERDILKFILNDIMFASELWEAHIEELFNNWEDDGEMLAQMIAAFIQKPDAYNLQQMLGKEKWDFGRNLLTTVREKHEVTLEIIKPKLKNWDPERIAQLDMILMQMGVCEFLFFETIPPKVTINEYIDLAKEYSTPQSGQFVNGILDNIHKELLASGRIQKKEFKKKA